MRKINWSNLGILTERGNRTYLIYIQMPYAGTINLKKIHMNQLTNFNENNICLV